MKFEKHITHLKDSIGQTYLGIKFSPEEVVGLCQKLKEHLADGYDLCFENKYKRDGVHYHITIMPVFEYQPKKEQADRYIGKKVNLEISCIGKATKGDHTAYFACVDSDDLKLVVSELSGNQKDFHITLGFKDKDVFGVSKGINTKIISLTDENAGN